MKIKKFIWILDLITLFTVLALYFLVYMPLNGSMIHKAKLKNTAKNYLVEHYSGTDYEITDAGFDFKMNKYYCVAASPSSADSRFTIYEYSDGLSDDYDISVTGKENTIRRIISELETEIDNKFVPVYPYRTMLISCEYYEKEPIDKDKFELDMKLDPSSLMSPVNLNIWVETSNDAPSWEELADKLIETVGIIDDLGFDIEYYSMYLQYPYIEEKSELVASEYSFDFSVYNVPKDVVLSNDLLDCLKSYKDI